MYLKTWQAAEWLLSRGEYPQLREGYLRYLEHRDMTDPDRLPSFYALRVLVAAICGLEVPAYAHSFNGWWYPRGWNGWVVSGDTLVRRPCPITPWESKGFIDRDAFLAQGTPNGGA